MAGPLFQGGNLLRLMDAAAELAGDPVVLVRRNGDRAQVAHVVSPTGAVPRSAAIGGEFSLAGSPAGQVLLSTLCDDEVRRLMHRLNPEAAGAGEVVKIPDLLRRLGEIRARSHAVGGLDDGAMLALRLPPDRRRWCWQCSGPPRRWARAPRRWPVCCGRKSTVGCVPPRGGGGWRSARRHLDPARTDLRTEGRRGLIGA